MIFQDLVLTPWLSMLEKWVLNWIFPGFGRHSMPSPAANDTGTALAQDGSDWSRDLATFDLGGHGTCGWCGSSSSFRVQSLKFVGLAVRKIWRTMCVSINGPGDLDLWPFDLETGTRVASKVGNLLSEFGHARPLVSRIGRYMYATDGRTDRQKQTLLPPSYGRAHKNRKACNARTRKTQRTQG